MLLSTPSARSVRSVRRIVNPVVAVLLGLALAACGGTATVTPAPSPSPSPSPSASASASPSPAPSASPSARPTEPATGDFCAPDDLAVSGGPWDSAAGSRGAQVILENQGDGACSLTAVPHVALVDSTLRGLVESDAPGSATGPVLEPGTSAGFLVVLGNWCDETVVPPIKVVLRLPDGGIQIQNMDLAASDLPPCNGPGQPPVLSVDPWSLASGL